MKTSHDKSNLDCKMIIKEAYQKELKMAELDVNRSAECLCLQEAIENLSRTISDDQRK